MSEAKGQQEPSMEEILASIRRIIAEDGEPMPTQPGEEHAASSRQEEILELTEVVEEDGTVVSLKPGGAKSRAPEGPADAGAEAKPSPVATPAVEPPRFEARLAEASPSPAVTPPPLEVEAPRAPWLEAKAPEAPPVTPPQPISEASAPEPPPAPVAAPAPMRESAEARPTALRERLVSSATAAASVAALSQLADLGQSGQVGAVPLGDAGRTLESLVRELLRPMLKDWLDVNLAPLVERLVQEEIRRLAREAQNR